MSEIQSPPPFRPSAEWYVKVGITAVTVVIVLQTLVRVQGVVLVVVASLVIALGLQPFITRLTGFGLSRGWAMAVLIVGIALIGGSVLAVALPMFVTQVTRITEEGPGILEDLRASSAVLDAVLSRLDPASIANGRTLGSAARVALDAITVAVIAPYFAYALPKIKVHVLRLLHREDRADFESLLDEAIGRISGFVAGNVFVSLVAGAVAFVALVLLGVPYPLALAAWIGLTDLIPIVGVFIGAVPAVAIAFVQRGPATAIGVSVFIIAYQQVENYVIAPRVMRRTVDLSPATVIIALMAGGSLAGVIGALLALPVAAVLSLVIDEYFIETRARRVALGVRTTDPSARGVRPKKPRLP